MRAPNPRFGTPGFAMPGPLASGAKAPLPPQTGIAPAHAGAPHHHPEKESTAVGLQVLERSSPEQVWQTTVLATGDILRMPEIGIEIPVAEIYEGIEFSGQDTISE